jgi:hypothetical protein
METGPEQIRHWYLAAADAVDADPRAWLEQWGKGEPLPIFADYPDFGFTPDVATDLLAPILRGAGQSDLPPEDQVVAL